MPDATESPVKNDLKDDGCGAAWPLAASAAPALRPPRHSAGLYEAPPHTMTPGGDEGGRKAGLPAGLCGVGVARSDRTSCGGDGPCPGCPTWGH